MPSEFKELPEEEYLEIYSRQIVLKDINYEGQLKLRNAKVCIVGLGGLGSPAAIQLTGMGVGHLRLVDRDIVERTDLHRQYLYGVNVLGYPKVEAAAKRLNDLNPGVKIEPLPIYLTAYNVESIIKGMDVVVDGLDTIEPRYIINRACVKHRIPYVFGAALEAFGNVSTIIPYKTPCLECHYRDLKNRMFPTCAVAGVHPPIVNIISSLEVSEAVRIITGKNPNLMNKMLFCDLRNLGFDIVQIHRREDCPVCGLKPIEKTIKHEVIEEICGRGGKRTFVVAPRENLELNMNTLYEVLKTKGYIRVRANLGINMAYNQKAISILKSGVMIAKGFDEREEVLKIYKNIIENLGIPWTRVE